LTGCVIFRGWKEFYTADFPAWKLSYALPMWARLLEEETGWGLHQLFQIPSTQHIPFFDSDYIRKVMRRVVKRGVAEQNWQPIFDTIREMPCEEDFERWDTNVRKDFIRRWYHTRSKKVQTVSLEQCMENENHSIFQIEDKSAEFEEKVAAEDYVERFKALLSEKDMKILELRVEGFTYEQIADKLGYKNHSGVIKRMRSIKKEFIKYENGQK